MTVNVEALVVVPVAVTIVTVPDVPLPIVAVICVEVFEVIVADVPPIETEVAPDKFAPLMVILPPGQPPAAEKLIIVDQVTITRPFAPIPPILVVFEFVTAPLPPPP